MNCQRLRKVTSIALLGTSIGMILVLQNGCQNLMRRGQSPDELVANIDHKDDTTKYVGKITGFSGLSYAKIQGIGLVTKLDGTGSDPAPSWQRDHLMDEMRKSHEYDNPKDTIASLDTTIVKVTGLLPPGAQKGDRYDIEVEILKDDETTSLHGGYLNRTTLRPVAFLGQKIREGNSIGFGQGWILEEALFESRQDISSRTRGWILGGGISNETRNLVLATTEENKSIKLIADIAKAINARFTTITGDGRVGVATAKSDSLIELSIPQAYRDNIGRFTLVISNLAYDESTNDRVNRIEKLETQLSEPALARQAAIRLEAIGKDATPVLKRALKHPDNYVKLQAAAALAYMGQSDGIDILRESAESSPDLRWHALAALTALNDIRAGAALEKLMNVDSAEARYGAFRAMKTRSPNDPLVKGQLLSNDFYFHVVPSTGLPLLHFSRSKFPEVVLFGENQTIDSKALFVSSGLTIKGDGKENIFFTRYGTDGKEIRRMTSTSVAEVIRTMSEIGCNYSTVIEFFRGLKQKNMLSSKLAFNALPRLGRERLDLDSSDAGDNQDESGVDADMTEEASGESNVGIEQSETKDSEPNAARVEQKPSEKKTGIFGKLGGSFSKDTHIP